MRNWMFPINICNWFWLPSFAFLPAMVIQIWPWLIQCYRSSFKSDNQNILVWLYTLIFTMLNFIWIFVFFVFFSSFFYLFSDFFLLSNLFLFFLPFFFSENLFLPLALKIKLIYTKRYAEKELVCLQFISISFDD